MPDSGQPTRIAILGGGMGALASAFELVTRHRGPERLAITVYERDHRLGGKGASGRRMDTGDAVECWNGLPSSSSSNCLSWRLALGLLRQPRPSRHFETLGFAAPPRGGCAFSEPQRDLLPI